MVISSLKNVSLPQIYEAFNNAFTDYESQWTKDEFKNMLIRRGFNPGLSFAAYDGNDIVSFTLNGIGKFNGKYTAYDTGTGTVKGYRGKGLVSDIFNHSLPYLKKQKIEQYLLEVLKHNSKAFSIYTNIGFKISREFNYYKQKVSDLTIDTTLQNQKVTFKEINIQDIGSLVDYWEFIPSWQNSLDAIMRDQDKFKTIGAFIDQKLIGYCIVEPDSGDIPQFFVNKAHRHNGIGSELIKKASTHIKHDTIKFINIEKSCHSVTGFLESMNIHLSGNQYEMIKKLN
ncbi:GNAT family N-acetyltransferase [Marinigracilibium pacificum]|uniref:GNAT family N-acetyltransferase n=1 Tax=Marinigracilibium pacificum TaxID=2729599 RepID=A0A848J0C5_9BACT|nr:GNAT family N-acetyltransferase [Marinigracilibium pacificum]NMM47719.1 GNAT family N-acetyltransferase [Marinigracilibium pacificum]